MIAQCDTFFNCRLGRLKLREFADGSGQLIVYHRPDTLEPTQSDYRVYPTTEPESLKEALSMALGCCGTVVKKRHLFMVDRTRVPIDEVESLGYFLELEVVLEPDETESTGILEAERLMELLGFKRCDLISGAYVDRMIAES